MARQIPRSSWPPRSQQVPQGAGKDASRNLDGILRYHGHWCGTVPGPYRWERFPNTDLFFVSIAIREASEASSPTLPGKMI